MIRCSSYKDYTPWKANILDKKIEHDEDQTKVKDSREKQQKARQDLHAAAVEAAYLIEMRTR